MLLNIVRNKTNFYNASRTTNRIPRYFPFGKISGGIYFSMKKVLYVLSLDIVEEGRKGARVAVRTSYNQHDRKN